jgi:hypothetical protein
MRLPPYEPRPTESLLEKCARLKREIQAASRSGGAANDNEAGERERRGNFWYRCGDME